MLDQALSHRDERRPTAVHTESSDAARSALERKLAHHLQFSRVERDALERLLASDIRTLRGRSALIERGAAPSEISVIVEGWACRYRRMPNGRRQIVAFYIPGDVCDFDVFLMTGIDQTIAAIDGLRVAGIGRDALSHLSKTYPRVSRGLWWESLAAAAIQREWLINIGYRNAKQRVAHLLCELFTRLHAVGLTEEWTCPIPLTQADIADACAMTSIHTNRTVQALRNLGLLTFQDRTLAILDWNSLKSLAEFDPNYIQLAPWQSESEDVSGTVTQAIS